MRKSVLAICTLLILMTAMPALSGDDAPFFDLENCAMCQNLMADPNLMAGLGWENHNVAGGMMTVTTFQTEAAMIAYAKAEAAMEAVAAQLMAGEDLYLCGFCQTAMGLMAEGAQREVVPFEGGVVTLMTASDPETIQHIHSYCETINMELQAMEAGMEG
jgi:hypothetical protein